MNAMGWFSRRSFQDWLMLIAALALVCLALRPVLNETHGARVTVAGAPATALRTEANAARRWMVRFVLRNQGDRTATGMRVRVLVGSLRDPSKLAAADDFQLANDLDPGMDVIRPLLFRGNPPPAAPAAPAPAGAAANAAATPAPAAAAEPQQPVNYVIVVQADYRTGSGLFSGEARRRWYFTYTGGSAAAVQAGRALRDQIEASADAGFAK